MQVPEQKCMSNLAVTQSNYEPRHFRLKKNLSFASADFHWPLFMTQQTRRLRCWSSCSFDLASLRGPVSITD